MIVIMTHRDTCAFCRCRIGGVYVANVRVNKKSLRTVDRGGLMALERRCPECHADTSLRSSAERWVLDAESQRKVDDYRARKGWAA